MALRKGKTKTNESTIEQEVSAEVVADRSNSSEDLPFDAGVPADDHAGQGTVKPASKEVAEVKTGTEISQPRPSGNITGELAESGFEGLELGFGSFPIIALKNEGVFEDTEGGEYDEEFDCIIQGTRTKYVIKNTRCDKKDETVVYSYDGKHLADSDVSVESILEEWAEEGWGHESKAYLEVTALLVDENGEESDMVLLSIPKTSTKRLSGYLAQNRVRRRLLPNQYITRCSVGDKITNVDFPFYPWKFTFVSEVV